MIRSYALSLPLFLALCCLTLPVHVRAEIHTITATAREAFGDNRPLEDARIAATVKARRQALDQAAAYLAPLAAVKTGTVRKNEIPALAAGIFEPEIASQKHYIKDDGFVYEVTARVTVNTATLESRATRLLADKSLFKQYQAIREKEAALLSRIDARSKDNQARTNAPPQTTPPPEQAQNPTVLLAALSWYTRAVDLVNHKALDGDVAEEVLQCLLKTVQLDPDFSPAFSWLGRIYADQGNYTQAAENLNQALKLDRQALGKNHPDLAGNYHRLGLAFHRGGQYDQAIDAYLQAWKIQIAALGESHPDVATTYNNLGESWRLKGDLDKAIDYYKKDLEISLKTLGPQHPGVATTYNNLAYALYEKGDNAQALEYFQKALAIYQASLGNDHPQTRTIQENIDYIQNGRQN